MIFAGFSFLLLYGLGSGAPAEAVVSDAVLAAIIGACGVVLAALVSVSVAIAAGIRKMVKEARTHVAAVRYQVENDYTSNLRNDLDGLTKKLDDHTEDHNAKHETLVAMVAATQTMVGSISAGVQRNAAAIDSMRNGKG